MRKKSLLAIVVSLSMILTPLGAAASEIPDDPGSGTEAAEASSDDEVSSDLIDADAQVTEDAPEEDVSDVTDPAVIPDADVITGSEDAAADDQDSYEPSEDVIVYEIQEGDQASSEWTVEDFTFNGTVVTGLSETGKAKQADGNKDIVVPAVNEVGDAVTEIGAGGTNSGGVFATDNTSIDSVTLPGTIVKIGNNAFRDCGISSINFPEGLTEIGMSAFMMDNLTEVLLPDTVTTLGSGAFATNPALERIVISRGLTELPASAFACSTGTEYMTNLTEIEIPDTITSIGQRAFAGNNFHEIVIPDSVKTIGAYAFSTKNYLNDPCTLTLPEGLETIGDRAFRNKVISEVTLPTTVSALPTKVFEKEYSDGSQAVVTKVYVSNYDQYTNFPASEYHTVLYTGSDHWTAEDFTYGTYTLTSSDMVQVGNDTSDQLTGDIHVITGFTDIGANKANDNHELSIPAADPSGNVIQGIGANAFKGYGFTDVTIPETAKVANTHWDTSVAERGDFFILSSAFANNNLTYAGIPEGTLFIGRNAFQNNLLEVVELPASLMVISQTAFVSNTTKTSNQIREIEFPEATDFPLFIGAQAFGFNRLKDVQLPSNTAAVNKFAFMANTGLEEVPESATANEKKGGVVYMYIDNEEPSDAIAHLEHTGSGNFGKSNVQKLITGDMPERWNAEDFEYDETGTVITGLSGQGQAKVLVNPHMVTPYGGITAIGQAAFANNKNIKSVVITDNITTLGNGAFTANSNLESVTFSKNLTAIPQAAFNTTNLKEIVIPEGVTAIGNNAFTGNMELTSLTLPSTLETIGTSAFGNHQLTSLEIPASVKSIGNYAFRVSNQNLENTLTSLTLNEGLESIGNAAFGRSSLTSVTLPSTVTTLNRNAFQGSTDTVNVYTDNAALMASDNPGGQMNIILSPRTITFDANGGAVEPASAQTGDKGKLESLPVPTAEAYMTFTGWTTSDGTAVTEDTVFAEDATITAQWEVESAWTASDFVISEGTVTGLSDKGAAKAKAYPDMVIPSEDAEGNAVTAIGQMAFRANTDIKSVVIPDSVTTLGNAAFTQASNLESVTFSKNLTEIPQAAFNTTNLKEIVIPEGVTAIGNNAFTGNMELTSLTLPSTLETIGTSAFGNHQLTSLEIPASVKSIGNYAFRVNNQNLENTLTSLTLNEGLESIGNAAFGRSSLTSVTLPSTVTTLNRNAFQGSTDTVNVYTDNAALMASDNPGGQMNIILSPRTITFDANIGTVDPATMQTGDKGKLEALPVPVCDTAGVTFEGWYDGETKADTETVFAADTTLTAKWDSDELMILKQPENVNKPAGEEISYTVIATGVESYQWYYSKNGTKWYKSAAEGADTATVSYTGKSSTINNQYRCTLTGVDGTTLNTDVVKNEITDTALKVTGITVTGDSTIQTIKVTADNAASYKLYYSKDGSKWYASTLEATVAADNSSASYEIVLKTSNMNNIYRCTVKGVDGTTANTEEVSLNGVPKVTEDPADLSAALGATAEFTVKADNAASYQWYYSKDGGEKWYKSSAAGSTTESMSLNAKASNNGMMYRCKITGGCGLAVTSEAATLTVG